MVSKAEAGAPLAFKAFNQSSIEAPYYWHGVLVPAPPPSGVDSSAAAIKLAEDNALLNGVDAVTTFTREDITKFMKQKLEVDFDPGMVEGRGPSIEHIGRDLRSQPAFACNHPITSVEP